MWRSRSWPRCLIDGAPQCLFRILSPPLRDRRWLTGRAKLAPGRGFRPAGKALRAAAGCAGARDRCRTGAVCLWVDSQRRFLTASRGFKKDPLGGAVRWCPAGYAGGWRCSCARPRAGSSHCARVAWAAIVGPGGCLKVKDRASGGACAASGTRSGEGGSRCLPADAACGRLCPGFPVASSPHGSRPDSRYQAGSLLLWCCRVRLDTGCPVSLATPADATGNPGQPLLWERFPHLGHDNSPPPVATGWTPSTPQAGCPCRRPCL
ncbi:hypothetical protein ABH935_000289 [Catenulispora sp. GAS73]